MKAAQRGYFQISNYSELTKKIDPCAPMDGISVLNSETVWPNKTVLASASCLISIFTGKMNDLIKNKTFI